VSIKTFYPFTDLSNMWQIYSLNPSELTTLCEFLCCCIRNCTFALN